MNLSPRRNVRKLRPLRSKVTPIMTTTTTAAANSINTNTNDNDNNDGHDNEAEDKDHIVKNIDSVDVRDDYDNDYDYDAPAAADNDNIEAGKKGYVVDDNIGDGVDDDSYYGGGGGDDNDDDDDDDDDDNDVDDDDYDSIVDDKSALGNTQYCAVVDILKEKGIERHYLSLAGGQLKSAAIKYIMQRTALLLVWTYKSSENKDLPLMTKDVLLWFFELITVYYSLVETFLTEYLDGIRHFSPSTCINYICDIVKAVTWFVWFREERTQEFKIGGYDERGIVCLLQQLKKSLKPSLRKQRLANSLENMIADRRFPVGGIAKLQEYMIDDIQWAYSIDARFVARAKRMYNKFLSILVSALYVFSPQGRVGGIQDVRIQQYSELLHDGYTTSSNFKTVGKFLLQPITISSIVKKILVSYKTIRDLRSKSHSCHSDFFFITFLGQPHDRLGRLITLYFNSKNVNLHITTTSLRSLVESEASNLNRHGHISDGDFKLLQNINGHSEKTSEQYYIKQRAYDAVQSGNRIFKVIADKKALESSDSQLLQLNTYSTDLQNTSSSSNSVYTGASNTVLRGIQPSSSSSQFVSNPSDVEEEESSYNKRRRSNNLSEIQQSYVTEPETIFTTPIKLTSNHHSSIRSRTEVAGLGEFGGRSSMSEDINIHEQSDHQTEIIWGSKHPEINDTHRKRNSWTSAELDYIGALAEKLGNLG